MAQVIIEAKYNGYIGRQIEQIERFRRLEDKPIPQDLDYHAIPQLRAEAREKFQRVRPRSLGQAGRISGISPADIATLLVHLKQRSLPCQSQAPRKVMTPRQSSASPTRSSATRIVHHERAEPRSCRSFTWLERAARKHVDCSVS